MAYETGICLNVLHRGGSELVENRPLVTTSFQTGKRPGKYRKRYSLSQTDLLSQKAIVTPENILPAYSTYYHIANVLNN